MIIEMLRSNSKWCEALSSDVGGRGALRVLLKRGVKFGIFGNSFQVLQMKTDDIRGWKNTHFALHIKLSSQKL